MADDEASKTDWIVTFPDYPQSKDSLARIVDADGGRDEAENSYYEACADPGYVHQETMQRRFRGQYFRRLRRLASRDRFRRPPGVRD
ncbi:hypothetical protein [Nocardia sp. NPDC058114]|uniref:hypothetical protein n=1 Tax=Nocardia sp. NPDC058114 TaxID=3346346 RepID=UPI0036DA8A95